MQLRWYIFSELGPNEAAKDGDEDVTAVADCGILDDNPITEDEGA